MEIAESGGGSAGNFAGVEKVIGPEIGRPGALLEFFGEVGKETGFKAVLLGLAAILVQVDVAGVDPDEGFNINVFGWAGVAPGVRAIGGAFSDFIRSAGGGVAVVVGGPAHDVEKGFLIPFECARVTAGDVADGRDGSHAVVRERGGHDESPGTSAGAAGETHAVGIHGEAPLHVFVGSDGILLAGHIAHPVSIFNGTGEDHAGEFGGFDHRFQRFGIASAGAAEEHDGGGGIGGEGCGQVDVVVRLRAGVYGADNFPLGLGEVGDGFWLGGQLGKVGADDFLIGGHQGVERDGEDLPVGFFEIDGTIFKADRFGFQGSSGIGGPGSGGNGLGEGGKDEEGGGKKF